jgi:hypothetical protein
MHELNRTFVAMDRGRIVTPIPDSLRDRYYILRTFSSTFSPIVFSELPQFTTIVLTLAAAIMPGSHSSQDPPRMNLKALEILCQHLSSPKAMAQKLLQKMRS